MRKVRCLVVCPVWIGVLIGDVHVLGETHETLFFVVASTSGLVRSHQVRDFLSLLARVEIAQ